DKQEKDIPSNLMPVNQLLEVKKLLCTINNLPKGVDPYIKKFVEENISFQTVQDYTEAENKFLVMKMVIQENEICDKFMSLVYFGRGLLRCAQKRYNGGLLEFYKSLQEIGDTNDHWFDIDPTEDEDLPTTFKGQPTPARSSSVATAS
ncbi:E3 ubiquitin-protein ligase DZIP3, partial [Myotis davidii]